MFSIELLPDLFYVPATTFPLICRLVDFLIVRLKFSKRATFGLIAALPKSFVFPEVRLGGTFYVRMANLRLKL